MGRPLGLPDSSGQTFSPWRFQLRVCRHEARKPQPCQVSHSAVPVFRAPRGCSGHDALALASRVGRRVVGWHNSRGS